MAFGNFFLLNSIFSFLSLYALFIAVDALGKTDGTASFDFFDPSLKWSLHILSVIKARFSCILVNFTCRFEDSPSVPERSYEQSVDILGYYYASISHVSTNYPLNFYTLSIDNSFMKVLKNAKSEMPTMFHSILPSKLPMGRMVLQCPNTSMKG